MFCSPGAQAAIPLLGPCDPDFRSSAGCSPGQSKDERQHPPATATKSPKTSPAPTSPAGAVKSAPAAKSPAEPRPETVTQVSHMAEETCPKLLRAEVGDEPSPLVFVPFAVGP